MSTLESIIEWAQNELPDWQSDAVRRLLTQEQLTEKDKSEMLVILKGKNGIVDEKNPAPKVRPLRKSEISVTPQTKLKITLKAMKDLCNVNAIRDGSSLPFGHQGLTIIYGENAAGKSGYARVLKKACNARDTAEKLLPNVYGHSTTEPARALFKISVNNVEENEIVWRDGQVEESNMLSNICVFDSKCARIIVDENNEPTYLPYGAHVFEGLVDLLQKLRSKLETEKPKPIKPEYLDISITTKAGSIISNLSYKTPSATIEEYAKWDDPDEQKLTNLKRQIAEIEITGPEKQVLRLRNLKARIERLLEAIEVIDLNLSETKALNLQEQINRLNAAEDALAIASKKSLAGEPLSGVGEKTWQMLYNAAKEYSIQKAYPGEDFPVIREGSICVLCMQPLSNDAKARMKRFKNFMEEATRKEVESALEALQGTIKELEEVKFPTFESYKDILDEIRDQHKDDDKQLEDYFPGMETRANGMTKVANSREIHPFPPVKPSPKEEFQKIAQKLEASAKEIENAAKPEGLAQKKIEKSEVESRKLFAERKNEILKYLEQLKVAQKYDSCLAQTEFVEITLKGKKITTAALTPQLKTALERELKTLGADHLPLNLKPTGVEGETRHKLELKGCQPLRKTSLSEILSEGERCVVGIAGFLAELEVANHECPIVLDDPICSLDHLYREKIAKRLAKEATKRQVIIFTHDIAFLLDLEARAGEFGSSFYAQTIYKIGDEIGKCSGSLPWHAMSVKQRLATLNSNLNEIRRLHKSNQEEYNKEAAGLYGYLRETWEAFIEEVLLNQTIVRHSGKVQTQRLRCVSVDTQDYKQIYLGMGKCSTWMRGHDKSKALSENRPPPNEIQEDITLLKELVGEIRNRHEDLRKERDAVIEPKESEVG